MSNNNIPQWIEPKLFEDVSKDTVKDFEKIINFKACNALAPGENYATVMLRIQIEILLKTGAKVTKSFMLKVPHDSDFYREEMSKWDMFSIESGMYHRIKPELENLYKLAGLEVHFGAASYELPIKKDYILLEDLSKRGFRNCKRQDCLDMDHCKGVLKKMAQWHAASAVRIEQKGLYGKPFLTGILLESGKDLCNTMFESSLKHLIKAAKTLNNHQEYCQQLEALSGKLTEMFYEQCAVNEKEFNVLNHGDCWSNNIMFQYNEEDKLQEIYFVDLQVPRYGSPAQDLLYFIITSAQLNIKINKFDYMIKYYYDHLIEYLNLLKYKKPLPSLKAIHQGLIKYGLWGLFSTFVTLPAVLADPDGSATPDNLVGVTEESDKFKEKLYTNERILKHFEILLPWLCYRGVFEC